MMTTVSVPVRRCLNLLGLLVLHGGLRHQTHLLDHQIRR